MCLGFVLILLHMYVCPVSVLMCIVEKCGSDVSELSGVCRCAE